MHNRYLLFITLLSASLLSKAQYCIPESTYGTTDGDYIDGVQLNTIINTGSGEGDGTGYSDFTELSTELATGLEYTITIDNTPSFTEYYRGWIDYDQDELFESSEELFTSFTIAAGGTETVNFTVPLTAFPGETRMRLRCVYGGATFDACSDETYSEAEDYSIIMIGFNNDVGVTDVVLPLADCELGTDETISVDIKNWGLEAQTNFNVNYRVDGGATVSELFISTINPSETAAFTFTAGANLSADGLHTIDAWTSLATDEYFANDSSTGTVENLFTYLSTGFPASVCYAGDIVFPSPVAGGGTWSGDGIINAATGALDPELIGGIGGTTEITYTFIPDEAYTVTEIPYNPYFMAAPEEVTLGDDDVLDNIDIGFDFKFFGNIYDDLFISSNGIIGFSSGDNSITVQHIPDTETPNNFIAFCWTDLDPTAAGTIYYELQGLAPERRFIIYYQGISHYLEDETVTGQVVLYEGSNAIDIISMDIQNDGGEMTQGIENNDGTIAYVADAAYNKTPFGIGSTTWRYAVTPCAGTVTETVTIVEAPVVDLGADAPYCDGEFVVLDAGPGATYYAWNTGEATEVIYPETTDTYWVIYSISPTCYAIDSVDIVFFPNPVVDIGPDADICEGSLINAGNPGYSFLWNTGAETQTIYADASDTYWVVVTNPFTGCFGTDTANYTIANFPDAGFDVEIEGELTVHFINTTTDAETFFWDFGDGGISFEENPTHTYAYAGSWGVTLTVTNECGADMSDAPVTVQVDIDGADKNAGLSVYPNPADDMLWIDHYGSEKTMLQVYNIWGEMVFNSDDVDHIDISHWSAGNYIMKIVANGKVDSTLFTVAHK